MTWTASLHGDVSHLGEGAAAAEGKVRDALQAIADQLVPDGHQGVAATFYGTATGDHNLLQPEVAGESVPAATGTGAEGAPDGTQLPGHAAEPEIMPTPGDEPAPPLGETAEDDTAPEGTA